MKKVIAASLLAAFFIGCNTTPDGFTINGSIEGQVAEGTSVYLRKSNEGNKLVDVDTVEFKEGGFSFTGVQDKPELYYVFIDNVYGSIPVVVENDVIDIKAKKDSLMFAKVKGTVQNDLFTDYVETSREFASRAQTMNRDMQNAASTRDTAVMNSIREEYFELREEAKEMEVNFIRENPHGLISALIISKAQITKSLPEEQIEELYELLSPEIKETSVGVSIKNKLDTSSNTSIGAKAPNFSAPTPSGEELALNDVLGKATILDFWAAWCKPCRAENPNVVRIYNKYKEQGLSILGVSLDRRAEDWKKAIADDGLEWHHVSNVRYFDEIAELYNVTAIPATFILDENGVIVAKNLRGPALEAKISEMLQ